MSRRRNRRHINAMLQGNGARRATAAQGIQGLLWGKFRDEAFQDEGTARQQAIRGTWDPMYLSYTLGKLIQQFRAEWVEERGGRDAWKDFHDTFLSYGMAPIPLIRQEMQRTGARN